MAQLRCFEIRGMAQSTHAKRTRLCEASCFVRLSVGAVVGLNVVASRFEAWPNRCHSKSMPGGSKIDSSGLQNRPSEVPKSSQDLPGGSRSVPRASQERPKSVQERPKSAQERPKSRSRAPRDAPESLLGTSLRLRSSEKATFEGDPSRDSVEKRVRNDFQLIFASCAEARTCVKHVKTYVFLVILQVFQMSPLLRAS